MTRAAVQLAYAPSRLLPWWRRPSVRRVILLLLLAGPCYFGTRSEQHMYGWVQRRISIHQAVVQRFNRASISRISPETVILTNDRAECDRLLRNGQPYSDVSEWISYSRYRGGAELPDDWGPLVTYYGAGRKLQLVSMPGEAVVYVHARRAPEGGNRAIIASLRVAENRSGRTFSLVTTVLKPPSAWPLDSPVPTLSIHSLFACPPSPVVRVLAGQSDPNDASHFVIPFEIDGRRRTVDCQLHQDDSVTFGLSDEWETKTSGAGNKSFKDSALAPEAARQ